MNAESTRIANGTVSESEPLQNGFLANANVLKARNGQESHKRRSAALNLLDLDGGDRVLLAPEVKRCCQSPDRSKTEKNGSLSEFSKSRSPTIKITEESEFLISHLNSLVEDFPSLKHPNRILFTVRSLEVSDYSKIVHGEVSANDTKGLLIAVEFKDIWFNTHVEVESTILVIDPLRIAKERYEINMTKGIVIVEPHTLISTTIISQSLFCARKAFLQDRFRGAGAHFAMSLGSVVHELFQNSLSKSYQELSPDLLMSEFRQEILPSICAELVALNKTPDDFEQELLPYLENTVKWIGRFLPDGENRPLGNGEIIEGVHDIEDNIWSPTIGVKGKIDVSLKTKLGNEKRIIPLELKTGKTGEQSDHKAQALMYSLLLSERSYEGGISPGIVLYLRDNTMRSIFPKMADLKGILNRRNLMAMHYSKLGIDSLPEPLSSSRFCNKCSCASACALLQKCSGDAASSKISQEMSEFSTSMTSHLSQYHLDYAKKWLKWSIIEWETAKKKRKFNNIFTDSPETREKSGHCLANVRLIKCDKTDPNTYYLTFSRLTVSLPHNLFEKGDFVTISTRTSFAILMGSIISYEDEYVILRVDKFNLRLNNFYHIDRYEGYTTFALQLGNITNLMECSPYCSKIRELVIDKKKPNFGQLAKEDVEKVSSIIKELKGNQARAIIKGLTCKDYLLIQGLPGSGKTTTIIALVKCLLKLGRSVLLTAYTNSAVDNMVLRLKDHINIDQILRIGSNSMHPDVKPLTLESKIAISSETENVFDRTERILRNTPIVATTCLMTSSNTLFTWRRFNVCIVDEASLALQSTLIHPISLADSFILVGDSRQLSPLVLNHAARMQGMAVSMLEHLADGCTEDALITLNKQFRMNKQICELSSSLFYDNRLVCANFEIENRILTVGSQENYPNLCLNSLTKNLIDEELGKSVLFIDTRSCNHEEFCQDQVNTMGSLSNQGEARLIGKLSEVLIECGVLPDEIGIISAYRNQVDLLKKFVSNSQVEINTIDQYQGRDKDVIFFSLVHTNSGKNNKIADKHLDEKRVNVAITRAKKKFVIVGCSDSMLQFSIVSDLLKLVKNRIELTSDLLNDLKIFA